MLWIPSWPLIFRQRYLFLNLSKNLLNTKVWDERFNLAQFRHSLLISSIVKIFHIKGKIRSSSNFLSVPNEEEIWRIFANVSELLILNSSFHIIFLITSRDQTFLFYRSVNENLQQLRNYISTFHSTYMRSRSIYVWHYRGR